MSRIVMPDGADLSRLVVVDGDQLRITKLPWRYEDSTFAIGEDDVACCVAAGPSRFVVDGLQLSTKTSWLFELPAGFSVDALAITDEQLVCAARSTAGVRVLLAPLGELRALKPRPPYGSALLEMPRGRLWCARDPWRVVLVASRAYDSPNGPLAIAELWPGAQQTPSRELAVALEGEDIHALSTAGDHVILQSRSKAGDAITLIDASNLQVIARVIRDATIPRWTGATILDGVLVVTDDRGGLMGLPLRDLRAADGARDAARRLRATWREHAGQTIESLVPLADRRALAVTGTGLNANVALWRPDASLWP